MKRFINWYGGLNNIVNTLVFFIVTMISYNFSVRLSDIFNLDLNLNDNITVALSMTLLVITVNEVYKKENKFNLDDMATRSIGIIIAVIYIVYGL